MSHANLSQHLSVGAQSVSRRAWLYGFATALACLALALFAVPYARATSDSEELFRINPTGVGTGQLEAFDDVATDPITGHIYVSQNAFFNPNERINEFTPWGSFVKAFGWDVAPGAVNEEQEVRIHAAAGKFTLSFEGKTTGDIDFDASAGTVESELDALETIGGLSPTPGSVTVSEVPGTPNGITPYIYVVAFKGSLAGKDVPQLTAAEGSIALSGGTPTSTHEVRTRADGTPGGTGLESCTAESGCKGQSRGNGAGQFESDPRIAVDSDGNVYASESSNDSKRVQKFDSAGRFELMFGGGVLDGGAAGTGTLTVGSNTVSSVLTTAKAFVVGQTITGAGIPTGTRITALGLGTITLSQPATASATAVALQAPTPAANNPLNERQTVSVEGAPSGSNFSLTFATPEPSASRQTIGGDVVATTSAGSPTVTSVAALTGTAKLAAGSDIATEEKNTVGYGGESFAVGQTVTGAGIPSGTTVESVSEATGEITLSANATTSGTAVPLSTIPTSTGTLKAGSNVVSAVTAPAAFPVGQVISGAGIPVGTTVIERRGSISGGGATLTLSANATSSASTVALSLKPSLAAGQAISGPGIPSGTTIKSVAPNGDLTLSTAATASATDAGLSAGIPYDVTAPELQSILEGLGNIGAGNVAVSGTAGGPWTVEFEGTRFSDTNVEQLEVSEQRPFGTESALAIKTAVEGTGAVEVCTSADIAAGDTCLGGVQSSGPGAFFAGSFFSVGENGAVYLPDGQGIEEFEPSGNFKGEIAVPGGGVNGVTANPASGGFYSLAGENVRALSSTGAVERDCPVDSPGFPTAGPAGNFYVASGRNTFTEAELVREFNPECKEISSLAEAELLTTGELTHLELRGLGTNAIGDLYVPSASQPRETSVVRAFGPGPVNFESPPLAAPTILNQFASSVQSDSATVSALINPHFWTDAHYYLQYGTGECSAGECEEEKPLPPGSLLTAKATNSPLKTAGISLEGLAPETTYHYRFIAESSGGGPIRGIGGEVGADGKESTFTTPTAFSAKADCPNQSLRSGFSAPLPDCRAYEMVSPVDKKGGDIKALLDLFNYSQALDQGSGDGERFTYTSYRGFAEVKGAPMAVQYMSSREAGGWRTEGLSPLQGPAATGAEGLGANFENEYKAFSPDLCSGWINIAAEPLLALGASELDIELYRRDDCSGNGFTAMIGDVPGSPREHSEAELQGTSVDGAAAVFRINRQLTPEAQQGESQTYLTSGGALRLVCILPDGLASPGPCSAGFDPRVQSSDGGGVDAALNHWAILHNALSRDGSSVYWTAVDEEAGVRGAGQIYLRENADQPQSTVEEGCTEPERACTLKVSETKSKSPARFLAASGNGSKAVFEFTEGPLARNLYEYNAESQESTLLAKRSLGLAGAGDELSDVYFVSEEKVSGTTGATTGEPNLYVSAEGTSTFIATLSRTDVENEKDLASDVQFLPIYHAARASADGSRLAFISDRSLTGYDNTDANSPLPCGEQEGTKVGICDSEVYVYKVGEPGPVCVSCNPSGAQPQGRAVEASFAAGAELPTAGSLPLPTNQLNMPHVLTSDGTRIFFNSYDALLPRDTNGKEDVYEWEEAGSKAECEERGAGVYAAASGGCVSLISSGESPSDSELLDASSNGDDVFFTTNASLLPQDPGLIDVYDARVDGGFPQPSAPAACEGEACQGPLSPPNDPTPASAAFNGPGNVREVPARTKKAHKKKPHRKKSEHRTHKGKSTKSRAHNNRKAGR